MNRHGQEKKVLKLNDYDKRILLAYSNSLLQKDIKATMEADIKKAACIKLS